MNFSCPTEQCPVCASTSIEFLVAVEHRRYWRCRQCQATYLDAAQRLDTDAEYQRYLLHNNDIHDPRYRAFLDRLAVPLLKLLPPEQCGLDYGCGPGPLLAQMLREAGHTVRLYDPFFHPDEAALAQTYDFITCSEVVEHFHHPAREVSRLHALLKPGGWLAVMTCFQTDDSRFVDWCYRRDPTHVVFYREQTFRQLARRHGLDCSIPAKNIVFLRRPPTS